MVCDAFRGKIARYRNAFMFNFRHFYSVFASRVDCIRADIKLRIAIAKTHLKHTWHELWR